MDPRRFDVVGFRLHVSTDIRREIIYISIDDYKKLPKYDPVKRALDEFLEELKK